MTVRGCVGCSIPFWFVFWTLVIVVVLIAVM